MSAVVLNRTTVGYINYKPAGSFYEARSAAPDVVIGAFPSAHEARQAIFADRRARQAELQRNRPRHPAGTKPIFRGERLIGWISADNGGVDAILVDGEIRGPFATESAARKEINAAWGKGRARLPAVYGLAARRRAELVRLALHRNVRGQTIEGEAMAMAMADALVFSLTGADYPAMLELARACRFRLEEADIMSAVRKVSAAAKTKGRAYRPFAPRAMARMLGVTLAEKKELELRTVAAIDETREEADDRRRAERRAYERERNKRRRIDRGATPHEESLSRTKPWAAAGISRSTWYARKAQQSSDIPASGKPESTVGQIRPPTIQGRGFASSAVEFVQQHGLRRDGQAAKGEGRSDGAEVIDLRRARSPWPPTGRPTGTDGASMAGRATDASLRTESEVPRPKLLGEADLKGLHQLANRLRWDSGICDKLTREEVLRRLVATVGAGPEAEEDEDELEEIERERDWLRSRYVRMDDQLLLDQIGYGEEASSSVDLEELLDGGSKMPRGRLMRSRLIDYLVDRDLTA
jgi:hypothetical protein